jgi:hypothetical protein
VPTGTHPLLATFVLTGTPPLLATFVLTGTRPLLATFVLTGTRPLLPTFVLTDTPPLLATLVAWFRNSHNIATPTVTPCAPVVLQLSLLSAVLFHARRASVGICCDSYGADGRDEISTLYVPSCTAVTLLLIAVIVMIGIISNTTTTHPLLGFAVMLFPSDEPHSSVAAIR